MALKWTEDKYREAVAWQEKHNKSQAEAEAQFGMSLNYLSHLRSRYDAKKPLKHRRAEVTKNYVDIIHQPVKTDGIVTIIRCQPNQLAEILGGLK